MTYAKCLIGVISITFHMLTTTVRALCECKKITMAHMEEYVWPGSLTRWASIQRCHAKARLDWTWENRPGDNSIFYAAIKECLSTDYSSERNYFADY